MAAIFVAQISPVAMAAQPIGVANMMDVSDLIAVIFVSPGSAVAPWK